MKTIKIAMTCLLAFASLPGISQQLPSMPALSSGHMAVGSANDHAIQKLNMELTKAKAEFAQELGKVKKDIAELTSGLAWHKANYAKHKHAYAKPSSSFHKAKAFCNGVECSPSITYDLHKPGATEDFVTPPVWQAGD